MGRPEPRADNGRKNHIFSLPESLSVHLAHGPPRRRLQLDDVMIFRQLDTTMRRHTNAAQILRAIWAFCPSSWVIFALACPSFSRSILHDKIIIFHVRPACAGPAWGTGHGLYRKLNSWKKCVPSGLGSHHVLNQFPWIADPVHL